MTIDLTRELTVPEAAHLLGMHEHSIHRAIKFGQLKARRFSKYFAIHPHDLERFCREHRNVRFQEIAPFI